MRKYEQKSVFLYDDPRGALTAAILIASDRITIQPDLHQGRSVYILILKLVF